MVIGGTQLVHGETVARVRFASHLRHALLVRQPRRPRAELLARQSARLDHPADHVPDRVRRHEVRTHRATGRGRLELLCQKLRDGAALVDPSILGHHRVDRQRLRQGADELSNRLVHHSQSSGLQGRCVLGDRGLGGHDLGGRSLGGHGLGGRGLGGHSLGGRVIQVHIILGHVEQIGRFHAQHGILQALLVDAVLLAELDGFRLPEEGDLVLLLEGLDLFDQACAQRALGRVLAGGVRVPRGHHEDVGAGAPHVWDSHVEAAGGEAESEHGGLIGAIWECLTSFSEGVSKKEASEPLEVVRAQI